MSGVYTPKRNGKAGSYDLDEVIQEYVPELPTEDGEYTLTIADGVASWTAVEA